MSFLIHNRNHHPHRSRHWGISTTTTMITCSLAHWKSLYLAPSVLLFLCNLVLLLLVPLSCLVLCEDDSDDGWLMAQPLSYNNIIGHALRAHHPLTNQPTSQPTIGNFCSTAVLNRIQLNLKAPHADWTVHSKASPSVPPSIAHHHHVLLPSFTGATDNQRDRQTDRPDRLWSGVQTMPFAVLRCTN